jgi:hypothetical protein
MAFLHLPDPPVEERGSFRQRILKKYEAYQVKRRDGRTNANQDQGERYEIAVALHLYRNHLLNRSEYLSRWLLPGETGEQSINMGLNNEYDFLLPDAHGVMLGDAKSESSRLGVYLKKAVSFCLLDFHVKRRADRLAGFCFATPSQPATLFRTALRNALEILTTLSDCAGITGMNSQLIPTDVKLYFRGRYLSRNGTIREDALGRGQEYYLRELQERAGFTFQFLQVVPMGEAELAQQMQFLAQKARWTTR